MKAPRSSSGRWRAMTHADLGSIVRIADRCHPDFPEDPGIFAERLQLFPMGCAVFMHDGRAAGYQIAHPAIDGSPIPLNRLLGTLAADADALYVHDLAIAQEARGLAAAGSAVANMKRLARDLGFQRLALVAVNGSSEFWGRQGLYRPGRSEPRHLHCSRGLRDDAVATASCDLEDCDDHCDNRHHQSDQAG